MKKPNRNKSSEIGKQLESANKVVTASKVPKKQNDSRTSSCHSEVRNYKSHLKSSSRTVSMHKIPTVQTILNKSTNGHTRVKSRVMPETTQDTGLTKILKNITRNSFKNTEIKKQKSPLSKRARNMGIKCTKSNLQTYNKENLNAAMKKLATMTEIKQTHYGLSHINTK